MQRLAFAIATLAALPLGGCPKSKPAATGEPMLAKRVSISWGISNAGDGADVFLALTDETGKQVSHALGHFTGVCANAAPGKNMNALSAVDCKNGATGWELQAIPQHTEVIVMKMRLDDGVAPDPMSREELTRVKVPAGAAIDGATN